MMKMRSSFLRTKLTIAFAAAAMAVRGVELGASAYSSNRGVVQAIAVQVVVVSWWIFGAVGRACRVL